MLAKSFRLFPLALVPFACFGADAAQSCRPGGVPTPPDVVATYAHGIPEGKMACRRSGVAIVVPAISHSAGPNDPPCGPDIAVPSGDIQAYKDAFTFAGAFLADDGDPISVLAGAALNFIPKHLPANDHNATANCGVATVVLPKEDTPFHYYVYFYYDGDSKKKSHPIDQKDFNKANAGEPFLKAQLVKTVPQTGGTAMVYGVLFKNWATGSNNYRHVTAVVDEFESLDAPPPPAAAGSH